MPQLERFDVLVLGSGTGGKLIAWHMAQLGQRTAVVERQWIGGACPNIACMPSKNEIRSAELAHLARHAAEFGTMTNAVVVDILENYKASGAELIIHPMDGSPTPFSRAQRWPKDWACCFRACRAGQFSTSRRKERRSRLAL